MQPADDAVCSRELTRRSAGRRESRVLLSVFRPMAVEDHFACEYRIEGLGSQLDASDDLSHVAHALGADGMQALLLAFAALRLKLQPFESDLAWFGQFGDLGVPQMLSFSNDYGPEFRAHIEELVARETHEFLTRKYGAEIITPRQTP